MENTDWHSFWINVYAGLPYFILGFFFSIWLIPKFTLRLIKKRNTIYLKIKISSIVRELCEFLIVSQFKDPELNKEHISIFANSKRYSPKFVGLCPVNVFNRIVYPKMSLVIYDYFKKLDPDSAFIEIKNEYDRIKNFRSEIEKSISIHSLYIDDEIIQRISELCSDIREYELKYIMNIEFHDLLEKTQTKRTGIFGLNELPDIYEKTLYLIRDLIQLKYFEYRIEKK
jgi:hypothetical protein